MGENRELCVVGGGIDQKAGQNVGSKFSSMAGPAESTTPIYMESKEQLLPVLRKLKRYLLQSTTPRSARSGLLVSRCTSI